ncbi:lysis protein [Winslowiella toletana]|uniref:lysis protein n=1 Tax=Winslowiella toletana TaxID=92490 RepID=UPI001F516C68
MDAKYTRGQADAKAKLDALQLCVSSGKCGLRINATSSKNGPVSASPRLNDAAEWDYFILRKRIEIAGKQIAGLQQYIREQCVKSLLQKPLTEQLLIIVTSFYRFCARLRHTCAF